MLSNSILTEVEQRSYCAYTLMVSHSQYISYRHDTYSIKVEKSSEPAGAFQICFRYFISFSMKGFFMKIFKISQTVVTLNIISTVKEIDFEKTTRYFLTDITAATLISIATF